MPLNKILIFLEENFKQADEAVNHLSISIERCKKISQNKDLTEEQLHEYEFSNLNGLVNFILTNANTLTDTVKKSKAIFFKSLF